MFLMLSLWRGTGQGRTQRQARWICIFQLSWNALSKHLITSMRLDPFRPRQVKKFSDGDIRERFFLVRCSLSCGHSCIAQYCGVGRVDGIDDHLRKKQSGMEADRKEVRTLYVPVSKDRGVPFTGLLPSMKRAAYICAEASCRE